MHLGVVIVALILCVTLVHCEAQVTFSAGWNPGKRNANPAYVASFAGSAGKPIRPTIKAVMTVCQLLLKQVQDLANCEPAKFDQRHGDTDSTILFDNK